MTNKPEPKRKNYSLDHERSLDLAEHALGMTREIGKSVPRQDILDALVLCLGDPVVYKKVFNIIKKNA